MFVFTIGHSLFLKHLRMGGRSVLCSRLLSTVKETVEMHTRTRFFAAMCKQFWSRPRRWDASDMSSHTNVCSCISYLLVLHAQHYATWSELAGRLMCWSLFYRYTSETKVVIMDEVPRSWYRHLGIVLNWLTAGLHVATADMSRSTTWWDRRRNTLSSWQSSASRLSLDHLSRKNYRYPQIV